MLLVALTPLRSAPSPQLPPPCRPRPVAIAHLPTCLQGQVLVRLTMRPCNPADIFSIMGVYPGFQPKALPAVPGLEGGVGWGGVGCVRGWGRRQC